VTEIEDDFSIINHYQDLGAASRLGADATKLPALSLTTLPNGDVVESLNAEFRIQNGSVSIDGASASLGQANVDGNGVKETLDGFYVDGGISGGGATLNSDDTGVYDLAADAMEFPGLSDPYVEPGTGTTYGSSRSYLNGHSMSVPIDEISADVSSYHKEDANGNLFDWNRSTETLEIQGIIKIADGDLEIGDSGGRINYVGTGTIWADRIEVEGDLVPVGDYLDVDGGGTVNNIGLIAADRLRVAAGNGSQALTMMAAMYAGTEFRVDRSARIAGTVMAPYFDKTRGFEIYQVPVLASNLPPGMPDSRKVSIVSVSLADWYTER